MIKLDYFTLLSPEPVRIPGVGSVKAPRLKDIAQIGYSAYQRYLSLLYMDISDYYDTIFASSDAYFHSFSPQEKALILDTRQQYEALDADRRKQFCLFDAAVWDPVFFNLLTLAISFFLTDEILFDENEKILKTYNGTLDENGEKQVTGIISSQNFTEVTDIILQRANIQRKKADSEHIKVKNQTAARLLEKLENASRQTDEQVNKKMELPNLISALASHHNSINMINVWDLTVYQLYDQFYRTRLDDWYAIHARSISVWGDKEKKFDDTEWLSLTQVT